MFGLLKKRKEETRSNSGFTAEIMSARHSYITGKQGIAELTSTVQSCISLWENAFALADVAGTDLLSRSDLSIIGRMVALRGEVVFYITENGLIPAFNWDLTTSLGKPKAYRLSIADIGGAQTITALAGEVLHLRIGSDVNAPYAGTSPLMRSSLTMGLVATIESALSEIYETAPLGSQIVPFPESKVDEMTRLEMGIRGKRGKVMLRESVNVTAAGGAAPSQDWKSQDLTPDLSRSLTRENLKDARNSVSNAFGVLPALLSENATGPLVREAQRHLAQWTLQPIAMLLSEEISAKIGDEIMVNVLRPLQAYDLGGRTRSLNAFIQALAQAKEAGLSPEEVNTALTMVNFGENDHAA